MNKYAKTEPTSIQSLFNSIAARYDFTNAVLSFNLHRYWNRQLVEKARAGIGSSPHTYLDLCAGTGDIAYTHLKSTKSTCQVYFIDFSQEMLNQAIIKSQQGHFQDHTLEFLQADVHAIPLDNACADFATMAYGIRNVKNPEQSFREVYRLLKGGGRFGILELTRPENRLLNLGHRIYLKTLLPLMGKVVTRNRDAYDYLQESIKNFAAPVVLGKLLENVGFQGVQIIPLSGGIATLILAEKAKNEDQA